MLINYVLKFGTLLFLVGSCMEVETNKFRHDDKLGLSRFVGTEMCKNMATVEDTFLLAKQSKEIWVKVFGEIRQRDFADTFLSDWQAGDEYWIFEFECIGKSVGGSSVVLGFATPRLGNAYLSAQVKDGQMVAYSFLLEDYLQIQ